MNVHEHVFRNKKIYRWYLLAIGVFLTLLFLVSPVISKGRMDSNDWLFESGVAVVCSVAVWAYWRARFVVTSDYIEHIGFRKKRIYYRDVKKLHTQRKLPWVKGESSSITFGVDIEGRDDLLALVERYLKRSKREPRKCGSGTVEEVDEISLPGEISTPAHSQEMDRRRSWFSMKVKEAEEWAVAREIGQIRYIWRVGVFQWGPFLLVMGIGRLVQGPVYNLTFIIPFILGGCFLGSILAGFLMWQLTEWKYRRYLADQLKNGADSRLPD